MTSEIEVFRAELKAAGEPWQTWGMRACVVGFVALVLAQLSAHLFDRLALVLATFMLAILVLAAGWVMLIVAFVRRRRWARDNAPTAPDLPDLP